ncbi:MAG: AMP-binding protein, partial [Proteobacteria bacterium]|nr:AMP-binding protein [Pseudomonadota bacterium]
TLLDKNLRSGDRIAIISEGRPEAVAAFLGILKSRCTPVLLDPGLMPSDLTRLLHKSDVRAVFVSEQHSEKLPAAEFPQRPVFSLNHGFEVIDGFSNAVDPHFPETKDPDIDLGVILFTSGTTADFSAVAHSEQAILDHLIQIQETFEIDRSDSLVTILPIHHVYPLICSILVPLIAGMSNTFVEKLDAATITGTLQKCKPTILCVVPRVLELFHNAIAARVYSLFFPKRWAIRALGSIGVQIRRATGINLNSYLFASVQKRFGGRIEKIASGGAALDPSIQRGLEKFGFTIQQGYGLTETMGVVCLDKLFRKKMGSVGVPLPNTEVKIINPNENNEGEVCIRGRSVMKGYFRDPETTAKVIDSDGWFHTGDIGTLGRDGYLNLTGRIREMAVTPSGKNVPFNLVEQKHSNIPYVEQLVVLMTDDASETNELLTAAVTLDSARIEKENVNPDEVKHEIRNRIVQGDP